MNDFKNIDVVVLRDMSLGCEISYRLMCECYRPMVHKFALGYVQTDYFATRIVEEVFSIVWNNKGEYGGHTPASFEFSILCFARLVAFRIMN